MPWQRRATGGAVATQTGGQRLCSRGGRAPAASGRRPPTAGPRTASLVYPLPLASRNLQAMTLRRRPPPPDVRHVCGVCAGCVRSPVCVRVM